MTPKQRSVLQDMGMKISDLDSHIRRLRRQMCSFTEELDNTCPKNKADFTADEINGLLNFNQRLTELELYLCDLVARESSHLNARVHDPNDPLDDYEIEARLYFILREDDPEFDEDDDNFLTQREIHLKNLDREWGLGDGLNHREPCRHFPGALNEVSHCSLFHDIYDHSYGLEQPALALQDCLRIDEIWVDVAVRHQATLAIKTGQWLPPIKASSS